MVIRHLGLMVATGALVLVLAGQQAAGQDEDDEERSVTVALNAFENNLNPLALNMTGLPVTHDLVHLVHDSLFWSQVREDPEPWLAESAEPNEERTEWTVTLREGLTWHDGEDLTAEDVAFTFDYFADGPPGRYVHHVADLPPYEDAEVVDETTVTLSFDEPAPTFDIMPGADLPILPTHVWDDVDDPGEATEELPVGSGPFEVTEIEPDQRYVLEANQDYFMGQPTVDRLELPVVGEPSSAFAALQAGQVDAVDISAPPELQDELEADDDIEVVEGSRYESVHLHFDATQEPLSDPDLRRALALAIDSEEIVDTVLLGQGQPGRDGFLHPDIHWSDPDDQHSFDVEQAEVMLDDAGYDEADDDGRRRTPDGEPLAFTFLVGSVEPLQLRATQVVADQLAEVGVDVEVDAIEPSTLFQRRGDADFDAFVTNLESHAHADPDTFYFFFGPGIPAPTFGGYEDEEFATTAGEAAETIDRDEREQAIHELQGMFAEDAPAVVLYHPDGRYAHRPEAYDGWISDEGHGTFTKRSFLADYTDAEPADDSGEEPEEELDDAAQEPADEPGEGLPWGLVAAVVVALVVVGAVAAVVRQRVAGGGGS